jgi:hypothetical protein
MRKAESKHNIKGLMVSGLEISFGSAEFKVWTCQRGIPSSLEPLT